MNPAPDEPRPLNIADWLTRRAAERPDQPAVILDDPRAAARAGRESFTFAELQRDANRAANGFRDLGITRGTRTLVMVKPGYEFFVVVFALFRIGAVPVMIDPGMGVDRLVDCVRGVDLQAVVAVPLAHLVRLFRPNGFRGVKRVVTVGRRWLWGGSTLAAIMRSASDAEPPGETRSTDPAAVLFTSGSTGPAKGVVYEHGMFDAQIRMIQAHYRMRSGEVDVPTFPLFALFGLAMGLTVVIPEMDASRPARADPAKIVRAIYRHSAISTFGSPALWKNVADYCVRSGVRLPTLRRILIAGAPVALPIIEHLLTVLSPDADVFTPYGATECLPVSSISGRERLARSVQTKLVAGTCVGGPVAGAEVRIIRITDDPIETWSDDLSVPPGEIGEIAVAGPMTTETYHGLPAATALAKIRDGARIWHRMGDVGRFDADGRLWYGGRKSQRVVTEHGTLFPDCVENAVNEHPDVARSALVGLGDRPRQTPVIIVEPQPGRFPRGPRAHKFVKEILDLCHSTFDLRHSTFRQVFFHRCLPTDVRHNAKINREALAAWAARSVTRSERRPPT